MFGPRGCWARPGGPLVVADTGNHRVLIWRQLPRDDATPPDLVLGQPDFAAVGDNQGYNLGRSTLRFPYAVALWGDQIVVADTGNSRLMIWNSRPFDAAQGRRTTNDERRKLVGVEPSSLTNGARADSLFGQVSFTQNGENRWKLAGRDTLCWPYGLSAVDGVLAVADSGNNRVLLWHGEEPGDERHPVPPPQQTDCKARTVFLKPCLKSKIQNPKLSGGASSSRVSSRGLGFGPSSMGRRCGVSLAASC